MFHLSFASSQTTEAKEGVGMPLNRRWIWCAMLGIALFALRASGEVPDLKLLPGDAFPVWISMDRLFSVKAPEAVEIQESLMVLSRALENQDGGCFDAAAGEHLSDAVDRSLRQRAAGAAEVLEGVVQDVKAGVNGDRPVSAISLLVDEVWKGEALVGTYVYQLPVVQTVLPSGEALCHRTSAVPLPAPGDRVVVLLGPSARRVDDWILGTLEDGVVVLQGEAMAHGPEAVDGLEGAFAPVEMELAQGDTLRSWLRKAVQGVDQ